MAIKSDLDYTYSTIDKIFRLSMGEMGDFSGAKYDGDFSKSLEVAQTHKHQFIVDSLGINVNSRVLDMGCGWGGFLNYIRKIGAKGIGFTLSEQQHRACRTNGLEVYLGDCRYLSPADFGKFDALVSVGAFEHFCSIEEYQAKQQRHLYNSFFRNASNLLATEGRFYLQTMVFGKNMIDLKDVSIDAPKDSDSYVLALMVKQFPGSWLPYGAEMVEETVEPWFKLVSKSSGRLDYIETIGQWRKRLRKFNLKKYGLYLSLLPNYLFDKEFRHRVAVFRISPNRVCFEREIIDHFRFVFEKN